MWKVFSAQLGKGLSTVKAPGNVELNPWLRKKERPLIQSGNFEDHVNQIMQFNSIQFNLFSRFTDMHGRCPNTEWKVSPFYRSLELCRHLPTGHVWSIKLKMMIVIKNRLSILTTGMDYFLCWVWTSPTIVLLSVLMWDD